MTSLSLKLQRRRFSGEDRPENLLESQDVDCDHDQYHDDQP